MVLHSTQYILGQIGNGAACVVPGFQFSYHCTMKDFLGLPLILFPSGVHTCDAVRFPPRDKSDWSPPPSVEDGSHIVLLALTYYLVANDSVWPKNYHLHYSQAIGMEGRQLEKITFCNSSASGHYNKEVGIQLWYKFPLILMLYCWNLSVFLSILKAFLAMPKRLFHHVCLCCQGM